MHELVRDFLKDRLGMSDEDIERIPPGMQKILSPSLFSYKIVAEVTQAEYCSAGCKVGDKLVVGPGTNVNVQESTCPLCIGVLGPLMERVHLMWDRIVEERDPNEVWLRHLVCYDPGLDKGGLGAVTFKMYAERVG